MSAPARPTRVNRNAVFASGVASRISEAIARIAPAPAQTPSTAAMIGCGQWRIALTRSPVMRVKARRSGIFMLGQRLDDLEHVAARAEIAALAGQHDGAHVRGVDEVAKQIAQLRVGFEGQRVLALGTVEPDRRDAAILARLEAEIARVIVLERAPRRCHRLRSSRHDLPAGDRDRLSVDRARAGEASHSTQSATS